MSSLKNAYLFVYNITQFAAWLYAMDLIVMGFLKNQTPAETYSQMGSLITIAQNAAILEVLHSIFGVVRSPWCMLNVFCLYFLFSFFFIHFLFWYSYNCIASCFTSFVGQHCCLCSSCSTTLDFSMDVCCMGNNIVVKKFFEYVKNFQIHFKPLLNSIFLFVNTGIGWNCAICLLCDQHCFVKHAILYDLDSLLYLFVRLSVRRCRWIGNSLHFFALHQSSKWICLLCIDFHYVVM